MPPSPRGLHHITAIAGNAQENLDFYAGVLGLRLVKQSVNQDDPTTYHLFYADAEGRPGTDLTFFPWPHLPPGREGAGMSVEVALAIPQGSLAYWSARLERYGVPTGRPETRFGETVLPFSDPHGLEVALVETAPRPFAPWAHAEVPEPYQIMGLYGARIWARRLAPTATFLTQTLGFTPLGEENGWHRFRLGESYLEVREMPHAPRGQPGTGSVHHLAWRVDDAAHALALRARLEAAGRHPTPLIDRFWFQSIYFREPGGVLFELATDGPGFTVDEPLERLGAALVLPPWLEPHRAAIEAALPPLKHPRPS